MGKGSAAVQESWGNSHERVWYRRFIAYHLNTTLFQITFQALMLLIPPEHLLCDDNNTDAMDCKHSPAACSRESFM